MTRLRLGHSVEILALAALAAGAPPLRAQAGAPPDTQYRAPSIVLVRPTNGVPIPADKPVLVFRFAAGEPGDPLDLTSFRVSVGTEDVTRGFTVTAGEAWGPLAVGSSASDTPIVTAGAHEVTARICSARGACATVTSTVTVLPGTAGDSSEQAQAAPTRRQRFIDLLLEAARRLIKP